MIMTTPIGKRKGGNEQGFFPSDQPPRVSVILLSRNPTVKKTITKRYPDGRVLSLLVEDEKLLEKSMTYKVNWDYDELEKEKHKGNSISFNFWEKAGLEVSLTYFGDHLVGKMVTLDFLKQTVPNLVLDNWRDELDYDISFPMLNFKKMIFEEGYCKDEIENPFMRDLMHDMVVHSMTEEENRQETKLVGSKEDEDEDCQCDYCGENPCVWVDGRDGVIANDENENGHTFTIENKTRRKLAFRHMFRVVNGGPGVKGVRKQLPECVEFGVRALFPDEQAKYMGFKEE
jgi:hypothetical protein